ncbi:MAG: recombination protein RecR [Bacteroidetes bacterium]|nr:recombination protein RecR [Bacteroidota bacterium]
MEFSSKLIEQAVHHFSRLPGVGKKSALRYVLYLIKQQTDEVNDFSDVLRALKQDLKFCKTCHTISDHDICDVCANPLRNHQQVCVVQDYRDVMAIENTGLYKGVYHVLGGLISPMDGIGPANLTIESLVEKVSEGPVQEIILALNATMEGETTCFYIYKKLAGFEVAVSSIARGIAVGDELEYTDEVTLGRSIQNRVPYTNSLVK